MVRWCFTFADYICHELGIAQISGAHFPGALEMVDDKDQLELCMANESRWDLLENKSEKVHVAQCSLFYSLIAGLIYFVLAARR